MRKIAEKRRKEAGFNSIEEWCRNTSSVGEDVGTNSFNLGYFLLLILILFFSLGTVNIVLGGLLDMDYLVIYKVLTWGTDLAILYAVSIAILVFGAAMFASHSLNVKSWFPKFDKMGKTDRRRSIVITSVVSILTLIYFIISFVFFL